MEVERNLTLKSKFNTGDYIFYMSTSIEVYYIVGISFEYTIGKVDIYENNNDIDTEIGKVSRIKYTLLNRAGSFISRFEDDLIKPQYYTDLEKAKESYAISREKFIKIEDENQ